MALTTFSDLVQEARERVKQDALAAGMADDGLGLDAGGTGATAYADAVGVYLAFAVSKSQTMLRDSLHVEIVPRKRFSRHTFCAASSSDDLGLSPKRIRFQDQRVIWQRMLGLRSCRSACRIFHD